MNKLINRRNLLRALPTVAATGAVVPVAIALDGEILPPVQHEFGPNQAAAVQADTLQEALAKLRGGDYVMVQVNEDDE